MRGLLDLAQKAFREAPCEATCNIYRAIAITAAEDGQGMDWKTIDDETRPYWTLFPMKETA